MSRWIHTAAIVLLLGLAAAALAQETPNAAPDDPVVARYGDQVITASQLEAAVGSQLLGPRQEIYDKQVNSLTQQIFEHLVLKAAAAEGMTPTDYVKKYVDENLPEPDEGEVVKLMSQYRAQLPEEDEMARIQVVNYLQSMSRKLEIDKLRKRLFEEAGVEIMLEPPRAEVTILPGTPVRGTTGAPVVLVEYTDFQCPYCARVQSALDELVRRYDGQILHVFKNLPLPIHAQAPLAAEAALCAADQDKFWEYHDWLFTAQQTMNRDLMIKKAGEMGMDSEVFTACLDQKTHAERVRKDAVEAHSYGINGTPGFLVNGRVLSGAQPLETFAALIDEELAKKGIDFEPKIEKPEEAPAEEVTPEEAPTEETPAEEAPTEEAPAEGGGAAEEGSVPEQG